MCGKLEKIQKVFETATAATWRFARSPLFAILHNNYSTKM
jgi:hypothetical protein